MVSEGILLAVITAIAFGAWTVFHQQASAHINPLVGAIIVSFTAVILGVLFFFSGKGETISILDQKGIIFAVLAGVMALAIDIFALKTYASGVPISIGGPIIIGGSVIIASLIGIALLGETINIAKVAGILFVVIGTGILSAV